MPRLSCWNVPQAKLAMRFHSAEIASRPAVGAEDGTCPQARNGARRRWTWFPWRLPRANESRANGNVHLGGSRRSRPATEKQQAQLEGLSLRATAKLLGTSRNAVRCYLGVGGPPQRNSTLRSSANEMAG